MAKRATTISHFLTPHPCTIGPDHTLAAAHRLMRDRRIRHLPVLESGRLIGLLSIHDLHLIETFRDVDPELVSVDEAMARKPFTVAPDAELADVAEEMAARKVGSAVVVDGSLVVGVFTTVDALHALTGLLRAQTL